MSPHHSPGTHHEWRYTRGIQDRHGPTYKGRKHIGRDSDVRGGVYYGTYSGEAIVVDPERYPEQYDRYYDLAKKRASKRGQISRSKVLKSVFTTVQKEMRYSQRGVDRILEQASRENGMPAFVDGTKIDLSWFMGEGKGVCRHQALACAAILERFKNEGHLRGDVSVDRNIRWRPRKDESDGHAWVRYTSYNGTVMILDVAQGYFGTLEDSSEDAHWNYMRPEEQRGSLAPSLGHQALSPEAPQLLD